MTVATAEVSRSVLVAAMILRVLLGLLADLFNLVVYLLLSLAEEVINV
jgi:hypothetical protein